MNGPGESKHTNIGVTGGSPKNLIYIDGKPDHKVDSAELAEHLEGLIRDKIETIKEILHSNITGTDEIGVLLKLSPKSNITFIKGDIKNRKITYPQDLNFF